MLLLDRHPSVYADDETNNQTCLKDNSTVICGNIIEVDYLNRVESKMVSEPFYGDIDLFGF